MATSICMASGLRSALGPSSTIDPAIFHLKTDRIVRASPVSSAVCVLKGVPIITTGSLKSRKNRNPGMPIFTGCVYFH